MEINISMKYDYETFLKDWPNDDVILAKLFVMKFGSMKILCPKCNKVSKFYRIRGRTCFSCRRCRHQIYPTKGTAFEGYKLPLSKYFYALQILTSSLYNNISAPVLARYLGCSEMNAWLIKKKLLRYIKQISEETP